MDYTSLITAKATQYSLPPELITAIALEESSMNPWEARFEPAFLSRYIRPNVQHWGTCSLETERNFRATSFGLMQIMGEDAREKGFTGPFLTQLCDPETGLDYGCKELAYLRDHYFAEFGWDGVIAAYNEGSPRKNPDGTWASQAYVDSVKAKMTTPA